MSALPKQLKSGRRLVATASGKTIGLYQGDSEDDFVIVMPDRRIIRPVLVRGKPRAPRGAKWTWLRHKNRSRSRNGSGPPPQPRREIRPSASVICQDCDRNLLKVSHYHTRRGFHGSAESICCACALKAGLVCFERAAVIKRKLIAGALSREARERLASMRFQQAAGELYKPLRSAHEPAPRPRSRRSRTRSPR